MPGWLKILVITRRIFVTDQESGYDEDLATFFPPFGWKSSAFHGLLQSLRHERSQGDAILTQIAMQRRATTNIPTGDVLMVLEERVLNGPGARPNDLSTEFYTFIWRNYSRPAVLGKRSRFIKRDALTAEKLRSSRCFIDLDLLTG